MPALTLPWRRAAPCQSEAAAPVAQNDHLTLFAGALQSLPDAVLIVRREGTAPAKIVASNAAAREMLRIRSEGEQLVSVLRHPDVLGAVEDTLTTDRENALTYDTNQGGYVVDIDKDRLSNAPSYRSGEDPFSSDAGYGSRLRSYWGS